MPPSATFNNNGGHGKGSQFYDSSQSPEPTVLRRSMRVAAMTPTKFATGYPPPSSASSSRAISPTTNRRQPAANSSNKTTNTTSSKFSADIQAADPFLVAESAAANRRQNKYLSSAALFGTPPRNTSKNEGRLSEITQHAPPSTGRRKRTTPASNSASNTGFFSYSVWLVPFLLVLAAAKFCILLIWGIAKPMGKWLVRLLSRAMHQSTAPILTPRLPRRHRRYYDDDLEFDADEEEYNLRKNRTRSHSDSWSSVFLKIFYGIVFVSSVLLAYTGYRGYVIYVQPVISRFSSHPKLNAPRNQPVVVNQANPQQLQLQQKMLDSLAANLAKHQSDTSAQVAHLSDQLKHVLSQSIATNSINEAVPVDRIIEAVKQDVLLNLPSNILVGGPNKTLPYDWALGALGTRIITSRTTPTFLSPPKNKFLAWLFTVKPLAMGRPPIYALHVPFTKNQPDNNILFVSVLYVLIDRLLFSLICRRDRAGLLPPGNPHS